MSTCPIKSLFGNQEEVSSKLTVMEENITTEAVYVEIGFLPDHYDHVIKVLSQEYRAVMTALINTALDNDYIYTQKRVSVLKNRYITGSKLTKLVIDLFYGDGKVFLDTSRESLINKGLARSVVENCNDLILRFEKEQVIYNFERNAYYKIKMLKGERK